MKYDNRYHRTIEDAAERVISSGSIGERSRLRDLLRYVVREEMEGRSDRLKAYAIGIDVFGRPADFNPGNDSIVRVEMARLRQALDIYYAGEGINDPVRITFSKGSYRPNFETAAGTPVFASGPLRLRARPELPGGWLGFFFLGVVTAAAIFTGLWFSADRRGGDATENIRQAANRIPVLITPFISVPPKAQSAYVAEILSDQIVSALARSRALSVFSREPDTPAQSSDPASGMAESRVDYIVRGKLQIQEEWSRVFVELVSTETGNVVWAQTYRRGGNFAFVQDELVTTIAAELRPSIYNAAKKARAQDDPETANAWQLYLQAIWNPGETVNSLAWEKERIALAKRAIELDPTFGQAHAVLAEKLGNLIAMDSTSDTGALRTEAEKHARRAIELAPNDADAVFNVALYYWHVGKAEEAVRAIQRTYDLDPNHILARMMMRFKDTVCSSPPEAVVENVIAFDKSLSPDNPVRWVSLYIVAMLELNLGNLEDALMHSRRSLQILARPRVIYQLAAILNGLNRSAEAFALIDTQHATWPGLDPRYYASQVISQQCGGRARTPFVMKLYDDLADAYDSRPKPYASQ
ncbi:MAG: hypothetical protein R3D43_15025 [Tepidamorphaceae bacterium]